MTSLHQGGRNNIEHNHSLLAHEDKLKNYIIMYRNSSGPKGVQHYLWGIPLSGHNASECSYYDCNHVTMLHFHNATLLHWIFCDVSVGIDYSTCGKCQRNEQCAANMS